MVAPALETAGIRELVAELRAVDPAFPKELRRAYRGIATAEVASARLFAVGEGPQQAHFASSIFGSASETGASLGVRPVANAVFFGSKKRTGWFGRSRYKGSASRNQPAWVGNDWEPGGTGGPKALNPALRHDLPDIEARFLEAVDEIYRRAFPDRN